MTLLVLLLFMILLLPPPFWLLLLLPVLLIFLYMRYVRNDEQKVITISYMLTRITYSYNHQKILQLSVVTNCTYRTV